MRVFILDQWRSPPIVLVPDERGDLDRADRSDPDVPWLDLGRDQGAGTALRWWAEREEARITSDLLGKQAIATVSEKNRELDAVREQLRQCLARNGPAT